MTSRVLGPVPPALAAHLAEAAPGSAVVCLPAAPSDRAGAALDVWRLLDALSTWRAEGTLPARVAVLDDATGGDPTLVAVRSALLDTAVRYVTGAAYAEDLAVNCVRAATPAAMPAAIEAMRALLSGDLDGVRGQTLSVRPEAP